MEATDISELLAPYAGRVNKQDFVLAMILSKLDALTKLVLESRYEHGGEDFKKAFKFEQEEYSISLKIYLDELAMINERH